MCVHFSVEKLFIVLSSSNFKNVEGSLYSKFKEEIRYQRVGRLPTCM